MPFAWYGSQSSVEGRNFGPLALIVPLLERMELTGIIDRHLPADPQAEFSYGTILSLLVAARLFHPVALSNVAEWAGDSGAEILWNMPAEKINDDRLGRALDAFFTQRHSILATVALLSRIQGSAARSPLRSHAHFAVRRLRGGGAA